MQILEQVKVVASAQVPSLQPKSRVLVQARVEIWERKTFNAILEANGLSVQDAIAGFVRGVIKEHQANAT